MKRNYIIIWFLILSLPFSGCKDFLTVTPASQYSAAGAYKTQSDFQQAIAGVYSIQQNMYGGNTGNNLLLMGLNARSDEAMSGQPADIHTFTTTDLTQYPLVIWQSFWQIISYSNLILDKIDDGEFDDEEMRNDIKGEAYMFRAWAYWNLGWQFGGMPLINKALTVNEIRTIPRSSQDSTFEFAIADYKKAISLLPLSWAADNLGRVTKYAAEGMLARLYMFQSNFTVAKPLLEDIINSGKYIMATNYIDCFTDSHDNGPERVWEVQYTGGQQGEGEGLSGLGQPQSAVFDTYKSPYLPFGAASAMPVSTDLDSSYESGDLRKDISIIKNYTKGSVRDTITPYVFKYNHYDAYTPGAINDWANNLPILRYTDVKMMYAEVLNEEGYAANGEAFDILNLVRGRAGLAPLTGADLPDKQAFQKALQEERRHEFAFEGLRFRDLIRWGIAVETMNKLFQRPEQGTGLYSMKDYQKLLPIPFDELSRYNDKSIMWQNPGY